MDEQGLHAAILAMIPRAEGKPAIHGGGSDGTVYVCRRPGALRLAADEACSYGECDWADPPEARPDELTDGMAISHPDCLTVGPGGIHDSSFDWYFVYDPPRVARSLAGDHGWVSGFLAAPDTPGAGPGAAAGPAS
ncbi:MAG: hypothetical protein U0800_00600 [Isosphaeraceae bacterium]